MSTPYPPNPNNPQQPGQQPGQPGQQPGQPGQQPGQPGQQPGQPGPQPGQGYGGYPSYGQPPPSQPTQQWQQPPSAPWGTSGGTPAGTGQHKNFFAKLFDLSFSEFVTPSVVKIVYILAMIGVVLAWLAFSLAAFQNSVGAGLFVLLIGGPLYALFLLIILRITFEFYVAVIRIAEDVRDINRGSR